MDINRFVEWKNRMDKLNIEIDKRLTISSLISRAPRMGGSSWTQRLQELQFLRKHFNTFDPHLYTPFGLLYVIYLLTN
jgi:hypothetical protein